MRQLGAIRQFIQVMETQKKAVTNSLQFGFVGQDLADASWKAAVSTGAVAYMDYTEVQRFASAYETQATYTRLQMETIDSMVGLQAALGYNSDPSKMSLQALETARIQTDRAMAEISALNQVGTGLKEAYAKAL